MENMIQKLRETEVGKGKERRRMKDEWDYDTEVGMERGW